MRKVKDYIVFSSPLGKLGLWFVEDKLARLDIFPGEVTVKPKQYTPVMQQAIEDFASYFENPQHCFTTPLAVEGTRFQQKVWQALSRIPSGKTLTYGQLAKQLQTGSRAIGQACRTNRIPIIIPCHRVVASTHMGGYSGAVRGELLALKEWLLKHEE
ncbi:MAG TPA: methylated-DNA--[protein]-cysteine S-methyltransferase [Gammaproteobacteria bacterium]|jgi:methylated-DNA-[protein]-cysteine S-methyltransferase|nr:methylated-DNA--[protein]-cysteine S-methyltransferase [Gammaproteobacteria bacterium]